MFQGRLGLARTAAVTAAGLGCLALAACGSTSSGSSGSGTATSATPSPSATVDPLAKLTASQVEARTMAAMQAESSVTMSGTAQEQGTSITIDLTIEPGKGCTGTLGLGANKGSFKFTEIGTTIYLNPDKQFWAANGGADGSEAATLVNGRYLQVPSTDKDFGSFGQLCDLSQLDSTNGKPDVITKGKVTKFGGTRVLQLTDKAGDGTLTLDDVTDSSKPLLVAMLGVAGTSDAASKVTLTYGAPVKLTAPPASDVLSGSQLGL